MRLSVIIPTYNRARYIGEAIGSALDQLGPDSELIVVDDGSTDATPEVVRPFQKHLNYMRVENGGVSAARNIGMRAARGEYISYLDDDDQYYPYKSDLQCSILDENPSVGMVFSEFSAFGEDGYFDEYHIKDYHESAYRRGGVDYDNLFSRRVPIEDCSYLQSLETLPEKYKKDHALYFGRIYDAYLMNTVVFTNSMMFRREVLGRVGYQIPRFGMFHDLEFALRICRDYEVGFIDIPTYKLRYHRDQVSTLNRDSGKLVAIRKQRDLLAVTRCHALSDSAYYQAHRQQIDRQFARLARAAALPLMTVTGSSNHKTRYYPRRARKYLNFSARHGYPQRLLMLLTYFPAPLRRAAFKVLQVRRLSRV